MLMSKKNLTDLSVLHSNTASNPADFNEMTQCFDMQAKKTRVILFIDKVDIPPLHRKFRGNTMAIT